MQRLSLKAIIKESIICLAISFIILFSTIVGAATGICTPCFYLHMSSLFKGFVHGPSNNGFDLDFLLKLIIVALFVFVMRLIFKAAKEKE